MNISVDIPLYSGPNPYMALIFQYYFVCIEYIPIYSGPNSNLAHFSIILCVLNIYSMDCLVLPAQHTAGADSRRARPNAMT